MSNLVLEQFYIFLKLTLGGIFIGFIYDLYRLFRYFINPKKIATIIGDTIFFILVSIIVLFFLFYSNWAELRWYVFLGFLVGGILYKIFLSDIIVKVFRKIIFIILFPLKKVININKRFTKKILKKNKNGYRRIIGKIKSKSKCIFIKKD
ncbi:MAG: spore cortex biosynthesis protein YabQ [Senegalia sp. (in: firmicutes)]|uniref:spore cortex biosynthesis protein YabQ n=1 Tax=Senegalia sp. (in: firmicutes) TaxID=1924098 RepID=UPI003F9C09D3